jgi:cysteinyl-tRNA synthetase
MTLTVYNTLTRKLEPFHPQQPGVVTMYVCGVTVYDYCHLGHARSYIVWDVVRRYLEHLGYEVRYVQNITDIDDKILKKAQAEQVPMQVITERYIQACHEDMGRLNILPAWQNPRATESIPDMIQLIQNLESLGYAYAAAGDVYYAVERFPTYGKLSHRTLDQMQSGASGRVEKGEFERKRHPLDFALWKAAKPGEPAWESPWGPGRPGWHIECSAMVYKTLGASIDIHAGGTDLIFPHHENEIAQSEPITKKPLARYWLHNGFVTVDGEKMSKSLGNFRTIRDVLNHYEPMALRLLILQSHYRQPIECTPAALQAAQSGWHTLQQAAQIYDLQADFTGDKSDCDPEILAQFERGMDGDFNTPAALAVLFGLAKKLKGARDRVTPASRNIWQTFVYLAQNVLGLNFTSAELPSTANKTEQDRATPQSLSEEIQVLIKKRKEARLSKNYSEADRIRQELAKKGWRLIDQPNGETLVEACSE